MWLQSFKVWYTAAVAVKLTPFRDVLAATSPGGLPVQRLKNGPARVLAADSGALRALRFSEHLLTRNQPMLQHHCRTRNIPPEVASSPHLHGVGRCPAPHRGDHVRQTWLASLGQPAFWRHPKRHQ